MRLLNQRSLRGPHKSGREYGIGSYRQEGVAVTKEINLLNGVWAFQNLPTLVVMAVTSLSESDVLIGCCIWIVPRGEPHPSPTLVTKHPLTCQYS
jgi:hypothetical protein